jgi:hypothetical protein
MSHNLHPPFWGLNLHIPAQERRVLKLQFIQFQVCIRAQLWSGVAAVVVVEEDEEKVVVVVVAVIG